MRLGNHLELPEGWQFSTYMLEEPFELPAVDGIAELVEDELSNTYQCQITQYTGMKRKLTLWKAWYRVAYIAIEGY